jgi:RNA polymerase sigma-70 factor (ECF subfamily)
MDDYRKMLFPYAYNILGSAEDARDAVQDTLLHHLSVERQGIDNLAGYLVKSVVNHSINLKNRRKKFTDQPVWLPEPVATQQTDAGLHATDILSYSMMILLERLSPKERAVFILKEAFGYSHEEIAEVLSDTVENSRKLLSRAKLKLHEHGQPRPATQPWPAGFIQHYIDVIRERDTAGLEKLLGDDITLSTDGGRKLRVTRRFAFGRRSIARLLVYVYHKFQRTLLAVPGQVNHQPAVLFYIRDRVISCQVLEVEQGVIRRVSLIVDPAKLKDLQNSFQEGHV